MAFRNQDTNVKLAKFYPCLNMIPRTSSMLVIKCVTCKMILYKRQNKRRAFQLECVTLWGAKMFTLWQPFLFLCKNILQNMFHCNILFSLLLFYMSIEYYGSIKLTIDGSILATFVPSIEHCSANVGESK